MGSLRMPVAVHGSLLAPLPPGAEELLTGPGAEAEEAAVEGEASFSSPRRNDK